VALDRGITIAKRYGFEADFERWRQVRDRIHAEVCERGFNKEKQAFVQYYDSHVLDSSNLLIPMLGFLPFDDPRIVSTVDGIIQELGHDGLLYRYRAEVWSGRPRGHLSPVHLLVGGMPGSDGQTYGS